MFKDDFKIVKLLEQSLSNPRRHDDRETREQKAAGFVTCWDVQVT